MMNKTKNVIAKAVIFLFLLVIAFTTLFPIYFIFVTSFKNSAEYYLNTFGLPTRLFLNNYSTLFKQYLIFRMSLNSAIVSISSLAILTLVTTMASFIFAKFPYKGSGKVFMGIVATMMVLPVVLVIPVYLMMSNFNLINNYLSLILFYAAMCIPFSMYLVTAYFKSIPDECIEAAKIDGAGLWKLYTTIMLPLGKPIIMTMLTLNFLWCWNEFLYSLLFLQTNQLRTLTVGVAVLIGQHVTNTPLLMTGLLVNAIPVLLVFAFANQYLVKGLTAGAIKA